MEGSISQQAPSASSMANRCRKMQQYQLIRSKRKTISVSFDQNIRLIVRAPIWVHKKDIEAFLTEKEEWISATEKRLKNARQKELLTRLQLENGDEIGYLGEKLSLTVIREERTRAKIKRFENRLLLWVPYEADYDYRQKQLEKWYRKEAFSVISRKAAEYAKMLGVSFDEIHIKDQKSRWGSCSGMKNLNFNWRIIMAPEEVCDYVIIHELCHLQFMDHSTNFWSLVSEFCPEYQKQKAWLKEHGKDLYVF